MAIASLRHHQHPKGKVKSFSFRLIGRVVANHPFIIVSLLFLICLHLYFPLLFSLLVFASPVLICTAMLLGTLLIHGQPNDNNAMYHEEMRRTSVAERAGVQEYHPYSTKGDGVFSKDRFAEVRKDIVEKGMKASGMLDYGSKVDGNTANEANREHNNFKLGKGSKNHKVKGRIDIGFANFEKEDVRLCMSRDYYDQPFKGEQAMEEQRESSLGRRKHADDTNNREFSDCESDGVEKCSLDALIVDVVQTPLETYPLLDSEDPLHTSASRDASRNFDLQYLDSNESSDEDSSKDEDYDDVVEEHENVESKDAREELANTWVEMEKSQQLENLICKIDGERDNAEEELEEDGSIEDVDIDEDDDDDDEEDNEGKRKNADEHESKQVTMWTEEDEKNLRLVGNSEFERDLRLENLLARRRAKRNFSMISEKNLIDLDRPILPFHVAPISTTRVNPFDSPNSTDYNQHYNIPPIPGSAPINKQKKNPFDSPCTSPKGMQSFLDLNLKEEPSEMNLNNSMVHESGNSSTSHNSGNVERNRKDAIFRRYESFNTSRYNIMDDEASSEDFMETGRRCEVLRRYETFNTRSVFPNKLDSPRNLAHFKRRPFFVPEHVGGDQEERRSSMSHDSDSIVSSSESDHNDDKDAINDEGDHGSIHSEDMGSESSDSKNSVHDDHPTEDLMSTLEANAELDTNQLSSKENETYDQNHDNAPSDISSVKSDDDEDHNSSTKGNDEDDEYEIVNDYGLSLKASSDSTIEPPVFDVSPSGTEKSTPFSSTHSGL